VTKRAQFLAGVFLICMCVLMLQIVETRLLSVISFYHLAFFAISMAMFGMTAGSLIVYFNPTFFAPERLFANLAWIAAAFAIAVALSTAVLISTVVIDPASGFVLAVLLWAKVIAALVPPYVFAGMAVSLALTRSSWPVGIVYGVDLAGAAFGCLGALALMSTLDGVSAMLMVGAIGAAASVAFALAGRNTGRIALPSWLGVLQRPGLLVIGLALLAIGNAAIQPHGLRLTVAKGQIEDADSFEYVKWNSYSRIVAEKTTRTYPMMWGGSPKVQYSNIDQRYMNIDGDAGTSMYRFGGNIDDVAFLKYDITSLAYYIRNRGRSAVIGVGGGRDLLTAYLFGFRDVTGVELNSIFVDLFEQRFRDFNHLADLPGVKFHVDEARSWFASAGRDAGFDLLQMSMVDTWAATGAGAFSLSENGLYTVEGWRKFLGSLAPNGVFTVSRWYSPKDVDETGRLLSLAKATLIDMGVTDPRQHLVLAAFDNLSTLIVGRAPFSPEDLTRLRDVTAQMGFSILVSPDAPAASEVLQEIMAAPDIPALQALSARFHLDVSPPTDDRPFFFNQLRITDPAAMLRALRADSGVVKGNLGATIVLLIIIALSFVLVMLTIVVPALPSVRRISHRLICAGTVYFLLIGFGFMFVEIGVIQRLSLFLGHPVYGLAVGLFAIILSTGVGSLISDRFPLVGPQRIMLWSGALAIYLAALPFWLPLFVGFFEANPIVIRATAAILMVAPPGLLMGFGFPTGMALVNAVDTRPTPWFWAINGAAGVLAASIAVAVNIAFSISTSIWLSAACYLLAGGAAFALMRASPFARGAVAATA
jgi:hypothetical protein